MAVKVRIPASLRRLTGGVAQAELATDDIDGLLRQLDEQFPGLDGRLRDEKGNLRRGASVFVNGESIRFLDGLATRAEDGDQISIVPAIAGGRAGK